MGQLWDGKWIDQNKNIIIKGSYVRPKSMFSGEIAPHVIDSISANEKRYILVISKSCPWSHGVSLVRTIKGLDDYIPIHIAGGKRIEGYGIQAIGPLSDNLSVPLKHLHQLYTITSKTYTGRVTVPVLWDRKDKKIISNESSVIIRALDKITVKHDFTLVPEDYRENINELNDQIFHKLSNGVYRAGKANVQSAYKEAVNDVYTMLDFLEDKLENSLFLNGKWISENDIRLFATLVRFDAVYATHFRCTRYRLTDYPNLWNYTKIIYNLPGVKDTVAFPEILESYYINDGDHNPYNIIAEMPVLDWSNWSIPQNIHIPYIWDRKLGPTQWKDSI